MSDNQTATVVGGVIGGIIGGYFGNPQLGFALGSAIGGALVPPEAQTIKAPRLEDTKAQSDDLGTPLAIVYGTQRVGGYVSWVEGNELREEIITSGGGKGGAPEPERETPRYFATFAVLLSEAPEGSTYRVRRVWADTVKIVDARPQEERSDAQFAEELVTGAPIAQGSAAGELTQIEGDGGITGTVTFFDGSEDQKPPARMVADRGKSPGHRGMAWLYFEDLPLENWGRRIPRITAEIVQDGVSDTIDLAYETAFDPFGHIGPYDAIRLDQNTVIINASPDDPGRHINDASPYIDYTVAPDGSVVDREIHDVVTVGPNIDNEIDADISYLYMIGSVQWTSFTTGNRFANQYHYDTDIIARVFRQLGLSTSPGNIAETIDVREDDSVVSLGLSLTPDHSSLFVFFNNSDGSIDYTRYDPVLGFERGELESGRVIPDGDLNRIEANNGADQTEQDIALVENSLQRLWVPTRDSNDDPAYVIFRRDSNGDYREALRQVLPSARVNRSGIADRGIARLIDNGFYQIFSLGLVEAKPRSLADVIGDLCARVGLTTAEIDTSELTDEVRGYVARDTTPRSAISQLRQVFPMDIIQSGYKIRFVPRGGSPVATLTDEDLQAHEPGQEMPPTIQVTHRSEVDMPRRAEITYSDVGRRLEDGIQRQQRQSTRAEGDIRARLPVAFTADEAVRAADVLLRDSWQAQTGLAATATVRQIALEPGDVITLDTTVFQGDARITQIDDGAPGLRELDLIPDGPGAYSSAAEGDTGEAGNDGITAGGPTNAILLDVPALDGRGLAGGQYYALTAPLSGWPGGSLVRHGEDGVAVVASQTTAAIAGYTNTTLGDGPTTIWDHINTVNVTINRGQLNSKTELEVLNGANAIAINTAGAEENIQGEWEILQFVDATLEADGTYTLSQLLRGRRGTERLTNQHVGTAARVVVLDNLLGIDFTPRSSDSLDTARQYSGVTFGDLPPERPRRTFTWRGRTLDPYSPVHVRGFRDGSGDIAISWIRRTRAPGDYLGRATAPLEEDSEAYEVDVLDGNGDVVRTLEATSEAVTYTASQQNTDFGSPQSAVTIRVYQISAAVGRGWPAEETV